jgi:two-component system NtrC family sensor kinase
MKSLKSWMLFLFVGVSYCSAQDTALLLSADMFDKTTDRFDIGAKEGWLFKVGSNTSWAQRDMDITGWEKMKPTELSAKLADKNGRAEGWFRIKIKPDKSFNGMPLGLNTGSWAAADIYLDGRLLRSSGNTGSNGEPFIENRLLYNQPVQIELSPGIEYTIALHVVDYVSPLPPKTLKSEEIGFPPLIMITGPKFISLEYENAVKRKLYPAIWTAVCSVLCMLFWLLYAQNPSEKNLQLIALCITFHSMNLLGNIAAEFITGLSFVNMKLIYLTISFSAAAAAIMIPLILANVFKGNIPIELKIFLALNLIMQVISIIFWRQSIILLLLLISVFAVSIYYVVSSWKTLRGAQWAIIAGLMLTMLWILMYAVNDNGTNEFPFAALYATGIYLSFPLSLLVYVSIRFKEIIREVQENAQQVVQLSEEKKEQAIHQQKILQEEVTRQTAEIRTTLNDLKATQTQLIQSEKMASLGELTAGIAHEIQNPLNFVNNFSDVNTELIDELKEELATGNLQLATAIADDIQQNEVKINHHGKRADAIVKGMLEHSKANTGKKEMADINKLADDYLRLSYHACLSGRQGLRAKDKDFNAILKTDFDEGIGNINIIPQDIGRVLLNLYNNAFYAVDEKKKQLGDGYEPTVEVSTKKEGNKMSISVRDNGKGIPPNLVDKIFQPFFTTKPTGSGTGLGLSLSYDIVKAHGGEIKVYSKENEGSEFIVELPIG